MSEEMGFEFINEDEIQSVKRGRKATVIPEMVAFFQKAKVGQNVKIARFALEATIREEIVKEKAKKNATIKAQAKLAGWKNVSVKWDVTGIPVAKRLG